MKKYKFNLRVCREQYLQTQTKDMEMTVREAKQLFANIITNDPSVTICEIYYYTRYGGPNILCRYDNHNGVRDDGKFLEDDKEEYKDVGI